MELLQGKLFDDLFRSYSRRAFHLEVHDSYNTPDETGPFEMFLSGQQDDYSWHQPWLNLVRVASAAGKRIDRVRVVTVPHVDYTRWGLVVAEQNIAAGEDVRWLPRQMIDAADLTADDFWIFDDDHVVFTLFEPSGRFAGGAHTTDQVVVAHCRAARDRAWRAAIPHGEYANSDYASA